MREITYSHEALNELEPIQGEDQTYIGICQYDVHTDNSVIIRHALINSAFINDDEVYTDKRIQSFAKPMNAEPTRKQSTYTVLILTLTSTELKRPYLLYLI